MPAHAVSPAEAARPGQTATMAGRPVAQPRRSRRAGIRTGVAVLALAACAPAVALGGQYDGPRGLIAPKVRIAGIDVSGMTRSQARAALIARYVRPHYRRLQLSFRGRGLSVQPLAAGYRVSLDPAITRALAVGRTLPFRPTDIPLHDRVDRARLRAVLTLRAARIDIAPVDATVRLHGGRPRVTRFRFGYAVDIPKAVDRIAQGLVRRKLRRYPLPVRRVAPAVTSIGSVIVIDRERFTLTLYNGARRVHSFVVAVGQPAYPTPPGRFRIVDMQRNPTWFPPSSPWAKGLGPIPPGVSNPLGTRWMGTSAPGIGIHGTPIASSLGTRASHGCIRMAIPDAERLYARVHIGTPVFIT